jgi:hypothetical protein
VKKESRTLALTAMATACLAFLFIYSWNHSGSPRYLPSGRQLVSSTVVLGAALSLSLVSLFFQIKKQ